VTRHQCGQHCAVSRWSPRYERWEGKAGRTRSSTGEQSFLKPGERKRPNRTANGYYPSRTITISLSCKNRNRNTRGNKHHFYTKVPLPRTTWTCVDVRWRLESLLFLEILSRLDNANRKCLLRSVYLGNPVKHFIEQRCGNCFTYLSHEVSYQRVICVLFFQTAVDVADHWHHISAAKKMNHSIQNCFLKLKLQSK